MMKRINSFKAAFIGIAEGFRGQWNIKFHFLAAIAAIALAWYLELRTTKFCIIILCCGMVIGMELLNTAIEKLCDLVEPNKNEKVRVIKDISAGAVLIVSIAALAVGLMIFVPKIMQVLCNPCN